MIVEFPALGCTKRATAAARKLMERARVALLRACGDPGSNFADFRGTATIVGVGVGFFDFGVVVTASGDAGFDACVCVGRNRDSGDGVTAASWSP